MRTRVASREGVGSLQSDPRSGVLPLNPLMFLSVLVILVTGLGLSFFLTPDFRPDEVLAPLSLPEAISPSRLPFSTPDVTGGVVLLVFAALLLLVWRRGRGHSAFTSLLPALILLLHPAMHVAVCTDGGHQDLIGLIVVLAGAWLTTLEKTRWLGAGIVILFLGVLLAPSGAPLAVLAAFVLLERVPTMHKGALLLLLYGVARANGLMWWGSMFPGDSGRPDVFGSEVSGPWEAFQGAVSALLPMRPVAVAMVLPESWVVLLLCLASAVGCLLLFPERRFGGRYVAACGLLSLGFIAMAVSQGEMLPPSALAAPLILLGIWCSGLADDLERRLPRRAVALTAALSLLTFLVWRDVAQASSWESRTAFFAAAARGDPDRASRSPVELAALRAGLRNIGDDELALLVDRYREGERPVIDEEYRVLRDLAVACALAGRADLSLDLLDFGGVPGGPSLRAELMLDRIDFLLRAGQAQEAVGVAKSGSETAEDRSRAMFLAREALARFQQLFSRVGVEQGERDAELARIRELFTEALAADSDAAGVYLERGRFFMVTGDALSAIKDLEACAQLRPELAAPRLELARLYLSRNQPEAGERELKEAQQRAEFGDPEVNLVMAQLLVSRGDLVGAVEKAEDLRNQLHHLRGSTSSLADLYRLLAVQAEDGRNYGVAMAMARLALEYGEDRDGTTTLRLVRLLDQDRKYEEAVEVLRESKRRGDGVPEWRREIQRALKNAGYARLMEDRKSEAFGFFLQAAQASEDFQDLGAVPSLIRSLLEDPSGPEGEAVTAEARRAYEDSLLALSDGQPSTAEHLLQVSLALVPGNPYAHYQMGLARDELGLRKKAGSEFRKALELAELLGLDDLKVLCKSMLKDR